MFPGVRSRLAVWTVGRPQHHHWKGLQNGFAERHLIGADVIQWRRWRGGYRRSIRTKATISIEDLPQGILSDLKASELRATEPAIIYPTVIQQARNNMRKFQDCVVLTRVGGFYELYFEQAETLAPQLNLKVGKKVTAAGPVPMVMPSCCYRDRF